MKTAYFDCFSGISGDMTVGALLDLGVPLEWLREQLSALSLDGFSLSEKTVSCQGIHARHFQVDLQGDATHRHYNDIQSLIEKSPLSPGVRQTSLSIFDQVADAESKIHGIDKTRVHFHEVGAIDSIVDIVGTALCLEYLGIDCVLSSKIPLGKGFVDCQHGTLPIPAPATLQILTDVPVYGSGIAAELVTPTGAAIIKTLAKDFVDLPAMTIGKIGYGAGSRDLEHHPNLLRIVTGQTDALYDPNMWSSLADTVVVIETCVDDMNPEIFGYLMDRLFDDGALDVYWIPVYMKKNRPGTLVQVLCNPDSKTTLIQRIFRETTSTGVRHHTIQRARLPREVVTMATCFGHVQMKKITDPDGRKRLVPEYESCKKIAIAEKIPIKEVYERLDREAGMKGHLTKTDPDYRDVP
jgi:pyridinium-3,5-bisthiocarboxylic acid mononucleotide nickel chelatase